MLAYPLSIYLTPPCSAGNTAESFQIQKKHYDTLAEEKTAAVQFSVCFTISLLHKCCVFLSYSRHSPCVGRGRNCLHLTDSTDWVLLCYHTVWDTTHIINVTVLSAVRCEEETWHGAICIEIFPCNCKGFGTRTPIFSSVTVVWEVIFKLALILLTWVKSESFSSWYTSLPATLAARLAGCPVQTSVPPCFNTEIHCRK